MLKGAALFLLMFIAITPQTRTFLTDVIGRSSENLNAWAPFSYIFVALLVAGLVASVVVVKTWPAKVEPENPMTKYKKEVPFEE
jgi:hypothetical protein